MTFDESRDNLLDIEAASIEADAHAETCEADDTRCMERRVADAWWAGFNHAKAEAVPDDVDHDADDWSPEDHDDGECPDDDEPDPYGFDFGGADGSEF